MRAVEARAVELVRTGGRINLRRCGCALLPVALAMAMGAPTLTGRFVGGDDQRLVLNHVLVSRPSLAHAWELVTDVRPHRDLYQPLPLISFSLEFAVCEALGWRADLPYPEGGAWLFHLTNTLIHAATALLAYLLLRRWSRRRWVACAAACLFAVHPLNVETVAWVNGRMMLLSTFFLLASMLAMDAHLGSPTTPRGVCAVLLAGLSLVSKVRVGLPLLMLLHPLIRKQKPGRAFWTSWLVVLTLTVAAVMVNVGATAEHDMFEHAAEQMEGSRLARCLLALDWYFRHFLWPRGLAAWYEAPRVALLGDAATLEAAGVVLIVTAALVVSMRWTRVGLWAGAFFLLGIGDTLPIVPARNLLAADRYMYLPIISLAWVVSELLGALRVRIVSPSREASPADKLGPAAPALLAALPALLALAIAASLLGVSWKTAPYYHDMIAKTRRIADVHPDAPWVHERLGWAYFNADRFAEAVAEGKTELSRHAEVSGCEALVLIGVSQASAGDVDEGITSLRRAVELKPEDPMACYRLATVLADAGHSDEAVALFRRALPQLPLFNPGLTRGAEFLRGQGLHDEARRLYEQVLHNNPHDPNAAFELARLDMDEGAHAAAARRLEAILASAPDFAPAWTNLGVCFERLGRGDEAERAYRSALRYDAGALASMLNLARIVESRGDAVETETLLNLAMRVSGQGPDACAALHAFYVRHARPLDAAQLWTRVSAARPLKPTEQVLQAFALALAGDMDSAADVVDGLPVEVERGPLVQGLRAVESNLDGHPEEMIEPLDALAAAHSPEAAVARETLLQSAMSRLQREPNAPWLYYECGVLQAASGHRDVAAAAMEAFIGLCQDEQWRRHARMRLESLRTTP